MDMVLPEASKCQLLMLLFLIVRFGTFKSSGPSLTGSTRITMWRSAVWTRPTCTSGCGSRPSPGTRRTWTYTPSTTSTTASPSSGTPYPRPMPGLVTSAIYLLLIFFSTVLNILKLIKAKHGDIYVFLLFPGALLASKNARHWQRLRRIAGRNGKEKGPMRDHWFALHANAWFIAQTEMNC